MIPRLLKGLSEHKLARFCYAQRDWFKSAGQMELRPSRTITIMSGTGLAHHFVQAAHEPNRSKTEQDLETANILLQTAQMMAASAGAVMMTQPMPAPPPPPEGAPQ